MKIEYDEETQLAIDKINSKINEIAEYYSNAVISALATPEFELNRQAVDDAYSRMIKQYQRMKAPLSIMDERVITIKIKPTAEL